ncbi:MAG TPA: hypothetical protein VJM09_06440 [Sphingobium sp.]|nr:hypothetical protein [Sphingobium sp.]
MIKPASLKTIGYLVSIVSVILLGIVSLRAAESDPILLYCLVAGILASIAGMGLRWLSYRIDHQDDR